MGLKVFVNGAATATGHVSFNGGRTSELVSQLSELCDDAWVVVSENGEVIIWNDEAICSEKYIESKACKRPKGCKCLCEMIHSRFVWTIFPDVADRGQANGPLWPNTRPSVRGGLRRPNGQPGIGTGGEIHVTTSNAELEFGAFDSKGNAQIASDQQILIMNTAATPGQ